MDDVDDWRAFELDFLTPLVRVIDQEIDRSIKCCESDPDRAEAFGWYEDLDDLFGLGFVACQRLLTKAYRLDPGRRVEGEKGSALQLGPQHPNGVSYASAVNAAANFWKHQGEWIRKPPGEDPDPNEQATRSVLEKLCRTKESNIMSNVLWELVTPREHRFAQLLPRLEEWLRAVLTRPRP